MANARVRVDVGRRESDKNLKLSESERFYSFLWKKLSLREKDGRMVCFCLLDLEN